jgi:AcrR family transcriptional regulator
VNGPAARRGRPPTQLDEAALLDAATATFAEDGFSGASVDDVARRAGLTKPMLFRRFGTKDGLLSWTVDQEIRFLTEHLFAAYEGGRGQSLRAALQAGARAIITYALARPAGFRLLFQVGHSAGDAVPPYETVRRVVADRLESLVRERLEATGLQPGRSANLLAGMIVGASAETARRCIEDPELDPAAAEKLLTEMLTSGMRGLSPEAILGAA